MLLYTEYESNSIDLTLDFCGYENCTPGYSFGPAIRENYVLHYIDKGHGYFEHQNIRYPLKQGDLFLLRPNESTFYYADSNNPWSYYWIGMNGTKLKDFINLTLLSDIPVLINSTQTPTDLIGFAVKSTVYQANTMQRTLINELHIYSKLYDVLYQIAKIAPSPQSSAYNVQYKLYAQAQHIMSTQYSKVDLTINAVAQQLSITRNYLAAIFKQFSASSPKEYLLHIRMKRAKQLLETTNEPIQVIAFSVGYRDPLHFSKAFKQATCSSPKQYRQHIHNAD
ncbi:AraC family ligand binding domain-containing protein [Tuanshanicoccus lijuaniae]|uniref:AraC family transcriptional regulator n=1 Tax=Aerococcaceae bacterium zg-1292 TaxID=2774330 RepID=UPI0019371F1D|nr:AraC family ligand binding domain-containing protein [Aerococcaceae bacterium zg-1292]QQA36780.1 AraC family ligand binding domain-containing protein [Aerococcaceae bacterium zg-1292]